MAEQFADGKATAKERAKAELDNAWVWTENEESIREYRLATAVGWCISTGSRRDGPLPRVIEQLSLFLNDVLPYAAQAAIIRDIFDPFRPQPSIETRWLSWNDGTIPKLAQAIYDDRAFDRLPILADALEEASCTDADILNHCRQPGEHVRGCWVVDLLLGKS